MTHGGRSATREHPPAHPTYCGPARLTINAFAEAALSGICSRAMHICFRSRPKGFIDELCLPAQSLPNFDMESETKSRTTRSDSCYCRERSSDSDSSFA